MYLAAYTIVLLAECFPWLLAVQYGIPETLFGNKGPSTYDELVSLSQKKKILLRGAANSSLRLLLVIPEPILPRGATNSSLRLFLVCREDSDEACLI